MSKLLHGGDYNPEQWLRYPGIIDEDFRLFQAARLNSVTIGVFSWAALEPEEGRYEFGWMDDIFERAARQDIAVILATPSGGKPNWLAHRYPEIRRVTREGAREPQAFRHNHCLTSPVYRDKVHGINTKLVERYGKHPSLVLWHLSNEYGGHCYCPLCIGAFQDWLRARYLTLDALNEAYWARFWSHTYTSWDQIISIDGSVNGLLLDWKRFMTHQCCTFIRNEAEPIRRLAPGIPVTANFMPLFEDYNYWELAREIDVVSWDSYPSWHVKDAGFNEAGEGLRVAFAHDSFRSMKGGKPFLVMETAPGQVNWMESSPLRRPGIHRLNGLQAIAHGSDSVCYFQLRKSRGSSEQWHGAVIDHVGHPETRAFRDVASLGTTLEKLSGVCGGAVPARVAILFDWENRWAIAGSALPQNRHKDYVETALAHYEPFWRRGVSVDVIDSESPLDHYDLVVAPMLYLVRAGQAERLGQFVQDGGTLVGTYLTGLVDATCLAFLGGMPGPLRKIFGVWVEESDALPDSLRRQVLPVGANPCGLAGTYEARHCLDLLHTDGAEVLATYGDDFYAGRPALTRNSFGKGQAYYVASRNDDRFQNDFYGYLVEELALPRALNSTLPPGVTAHARIADGHRYVFVFNFTPTRVELDLGDDCWTDVETSQASLRQIWLSAHDSRIFRRD